MIVDTRTPTTNRDEPQTEAMDDYLALLSFPTSRTGAAFNRIRTSMPTIHEEVLLRATHTGRIDITNSVISDLTDPANDQPHPEEQHLLARLIEALQEPFTPPPGNNDAQTNDPQTNDPETNDPQTRDPQTRDPETRDPEPAVFGTATSTPPYTPPTRRLHQIIDLVRSGTVIIARGSGDPVALNALLTQLDGRLVTIPTHEILAELSYPATATPTTPTTATPAVRTPNRRLEQLPRQRWRQRSQACKDRLATPLHPTAPAFL